MNETTNNNNNIGNFDKDVHDYIKSEQTSKWKWTILTLITVGVMIVNEIQYYNSCFSFTVLGCKNITSTYSFSTPYVSVNSLFSTADQSEYSIETCIDSRVQYCIPLQYTSPDNLNASFSFSITKESSAYYWPSKNYQSIYFQIYYVADTVFCILIILYLVIVRIQYVYRSRAHLLLSLNVVLIPERKNVIFFWCYFIFYPLLSVLYSISKYLNVITLNNTASIMFCDLSTLELYFDGKTTSSIFQIFVNVAVFMFIFKDLVSNIFDGRNFYDEIKLINLIKSKNSLASMERLKQLRSITDKNFIDATFQHINEKYPIGSISSFKRFTLTRLVFLSFFLKKIDVIPIVQKYYKRNPHLFLPLISTTNNNQDIQSITINEDTKLLN